MSPKFCVKLPVDTNNNVVFGVKLNIKGLPM